MLIIIAPEGRTQCGPECPFYEETGYVNCIGGKKRSHCRMIMQPYYVNCEQFDVRYLTVKRVREKGLTRALRNLADRPAEKMRKLYKPDRKVRELNSEGMNICRH